MTTTTTHQAFLKCSLRMFSCACFFPLCVHLRRRVRVCACEGLRRGLPGSSDPDNRHSLRPPNPTVPNLRGPVDPRRWWWWSKTSKSGLANDIPNSNHMRFTTKSFRSNQMTTTQGVPNFL